MEAAQRVLFVDPSTGFYEMRKGIDESLRAFL